jgi:aspartyl-tRNA(Asn)/glutamyl-tRNA(Gln) amidotransferase subunit A
VSEREHRGGSAFALDATTIEGISASVRSLRVSPIDLVDAALSRAVDVEPRLNALVEVYDDEARVAAAVAHDEIARGECRGPLHGIPFVIKDLFDVAGRPTTASSKVRSAFVPTLDSTCVSRLRRAGAVIVAKSHTHEFAYGGITPQSRNPWDQRRITGGSSGGTASAVAAGEALAGLGTDTAGSIRIPASCCGVVGIKPTFGRVSRAGVTSLSWSLDHVGPIARTVRDAALVLQAVAGRDDQDAASSHATVPDFLSSVDDGVAGLRIGLPANFFFDHCADAVGGRVRELAERLEGEGARIVEFTAPDTELYAAVEFTIAMAEASEYHRTMMRTTPDLYEPETWAKLAAGETILATDYLRALRLRARIARAWREAFRDVDVVLAPTLPDVAAPLGSDRVSWSDGFTEVLDNSLTRLVCPQNLTGLPALSLRCGFEGQLPFGAQIIGRPFDEATVFRVGRSAEELLGPWANGPFPSID